MTIYLYRDICELERKVLGTQLILARIYPNDFAADLMRQDGYTAVVAGEVIYLIQCKPVYVVLETQDTCFHEIPVRMGNITMVHDAYDPDTTEGREPNRMLCFFPLSTGLATSGTRLMGRFGRPRHRKH